MKINYLAFTLETSHIIILLAFVICFIAIATIFTYFYHKKNEQMNKAIAECNNTSHLTVDLLNRMVNSFNLVDITSSKKLDLDSYLKTYGNAKNASLVNQWLLNLLNPNIKTSHYLEIYVPVKSFYYSLVILHATKINLKKTLIHLDIYRSPRLVKNHDESNLIKTDDEIENIIERLHKNSTLMLNLISFYSKTRIKSDEQSFDRITQRRLIDILSKRINVKKNRYITVLKNGDLAIVSINNVTSDSALLKRLQSALKRFYAINNLNDKAFNMSVIYAKGNKVNYKVLLKKARDLSNYHIAMREDNNETYYYNQNNEIKFKETLQLRINQDVKALIVEKDFSFIYKTIFNIKDKSRSGYILNIIPNNKMIREGNYLYETIKEENLTEDFFKLIAERLQNDFLDIKQKHIYISLPLMLLEEFKNFRKYINLPSLEISIILTDIDIGETLKINNDLVFSLQEDVSSSKFNYYIELTNPLLKDNDIVTCANGFICPMDQYSRASKIKENKILYPGLIDKLLNLQKEAIFTDVNNMLDFETLISQGITQIEGSILEAENNLQSEVSTRVLQSLIEIYNKYY